MPSSDTAANTPLAYAQELIDVLLESEAAEPVRPTLDPSKAEADLGLSIPSNGHSLNESIRKLQAVVTATPATAGTGFFNQLFGGREPIAVLAEMLTAVWNT